jgi:hypothetical protein
MCELPLGRTEHRMSAPWNYSDPAYIHGNETRRLGKLSSAASRVSVRYFETQTGAALS